MNAGRIDGETGIVGSLSQGAGAARQKNAFVPGVSECVQQQQNLVLATAHIRAGVDVESAER
jgi:hypothetical protein